MIIRYTIVIFTVVVLKENYFESSLLLNNLLTHKTYQTFDIGRMHDKNEDIIKKQHLELGNWSPIFK